MTRLDRDLDRALAGRSEPDEAVVGLVEAARALTQAFDVEPEPAMRERALFAAGVGARGRSGFPLLRLLAPVAAGLGIVAALGFISGTAMPGDVLYPVRKVLQDVGLNEGVLTDASARMDRAEALLDEAEDLPNDREGRATTLAVRAIQELAPVEGLLEEADLGSDQLLEHRARLAALIERATSLIAASTGGESSEEGVRSAVPGTRGGDERDGGDRSGSGDGDGDSSGSGSDDGDDRSGSDDGGGDDSSGSDDGSGGDGSGSGSDDGDDRSGSHDDPTDPPDDPDLDDVGEADEEDELD